MIFYFNLGSFFLMLWILYMEKNFMDINNWNQAAHSFGLVLIFSLNLQLCQGVRNCTCRKLLLRSAFFESLRQEKYYSNLPNV